MEQLALDITGVAGDAAWLGNVGKITKDKPIDVTPLLKILEQRLRDNAKAAANSSKAANFGSVGSPLGLPSANMGESGVNRVFDNLGGSPTFWPYYSCSGMVQMEMARAVILTLEAGEFDNMGLTVGSVSFVTNIDKTWFGSSDYFTVYSPAIARDALRPGDWVRFWNKADYEGAWWNAESTIMVDSDSYSGWPYQPERPFSYAEWKQLLVDAYNDSLGWFSRLFNGITTADVQGYNDLPKDHVWRQVCAGFINVPKLGQRIFEYRSGEAP